MRRTYALLALALAVAAGVTAVIAIRALRASAPSAAGRTEVAPELAERATTEPGSASDVVRKGVHSAPADRDATEPRRGVFGIVTDTAGAPVSGAEVRRQMLDPTWIPALTGWDTIDWLQVESHSQRVVTDSLGRFSFDAPVAPGPLGVAHWVLHPGFHSELRMSDGTLEADPLRIELTPRAPLRVRVESSSGAPVPGAFVRVFGTVPPREHARDARWQSAIRSCRSEWRSGSDGTVEMPVPQGRVAIAAENDIGRASPWYGEAHEQREIVLRISPTFRASGRVVFANGTPDSRELIVSVTVSTDATMLHHVAQLRVGDDGAFGPVDLPLAGRESYTFELSGGGVATVSKRVTDAQPGETRQIELEARSGADLEIVVQDDSDAGVELADVKVAWFAESNRGDSARARTDSAGFARVRGIRAGTVWISASARGFVPLRTEAMSIPLDAAEQRFVVALRRGGSIRGRVQSEGRAVREFDAYAWQGAPSSYSREHFADREDGTFQLFDAPLGELALTIVASDGRQSPIVRAQCDPEPGSELQIELAPALSVTGRVVDASTLEPVANARVQRQLDAGGSVLSAYGIPQPVQPDGSFALGGLCPGIVRFRVEASGYPPTQSSHRVLQGPRVDIGLVALEQGDSVTVQVYPTNGVDLDQFSVELRSNDPPEVRALDANGCVNVERGSPGPWTAFVVDSDQGYIEVTDRLRRGAPLRFELPIGGQPPLTVRVLPETGASIEPDTLWVSARFRARDGRWIVKQELLGSSGEVTFDVLPGPNARIEVATPSGEILGTSLAPDPALEGVLEIRLGSEARAIRVVDASGRAVPRAKVLAYSTDASEWSAIAVANEEGRCRMRFLDPESTGLVASRLDIGYGQPAPLDSIPIEDRELRLVLAPDASLLARAVDHGVAIPNARFELRWPSVPVQLGLHSTDSDGRLDVRGLSAGTFLADVFGAGLWRERFELQAAREPSEQSIPVRRTCSVDLTLRDGAGTTLANTSVELEHVELRQRLSQWIAAARVASASRSTDERGHLRLDGLPHGEYRWSVSSGEGVEAGSGVLRLDPAAVNMRSIVLR